MALLQFMSSLYYHQKCPTASKVTDCGCLTAFQVELYLVHEVPFHLRLPNRMFCAPLDLNFAHSLSLNGKYHAFP